MSTAEIPHTQDARVPARRPSARDLQDSRLPAVENETLLGLFVRIIQHRKWTILAATLALPVLTFAATLRMTPLYTAYETVLYEPKKTNVIDLQRVLEPALPDSTLESQLEIIKSRNIAQQVVDAMGLVLRPEFNKKLDPDTLTQTQESFFNHIYRSIYNILGSSKLPPPKLTDAEDRAAREAVVVNVLKRLSIESKGRSSVFDVGFTSADPTLAREVVAKFVNLYIDNQLELKFQSMKRASDWLNTRLDQLREQVNTSERAVEEFRAQAGLTEGVTSTVITEQVSGMNKDLMEANTTLATAQANLEQIRAYARTPGRLESIPEILQNPTIQALRQQESTVVAREAELAARVGPSHPDLIEVRAQLSRLQSGILREVSRVAQGVENTVRAAQARVDALQSGFAQTQGKASKADAAMIRLRALEREARADQDLLQTFLAKSKEITQQYEIEEPDARILSPAYAATDPTFPKKGLFVAIALAAGLLLGFIFAYLEELLDQTFRSSEEVENSLSLPAVAIPRIAGRGNWRIPFLDYVLIKPSSIFAESVRSLRTLLWLTDLQSRAKLVAVTSSRRGEGKTTTAVSLARVAALSGERVMIIDCDLTRPTIHTAFKQVTADVGLTDLMLGRASRREATKIDQSLPNLHYITAGGRSEKLNELLRSDNMVALLREARNEYDLVVVDTPPALVVGDAKVLATMCDAVVYCIAWRATARSLADSGIKALTGVGANVLCAALTQVRFRSLRSRERSDHEAYAAGRAARTGTAGDTSLTARG